jgi:hypothetical protein
VSPLLGFKWRARQGCRERGWVGKLLLQDYIVLSLWTGARDFTLMADGRKCEKECESEREKNE